MIYDEILTPFVNEDENEGEEVKEEETEETEGGEEEKTEETEGGEKTEGGDTPEATPAE